MNSLLLLQFLFAFVRAEDVAAPEDNGMTSPVPDYIAIGESVGLVEPTSPIKAKETSQEFIQAAPTNAPESVVQPTTLNILNHGADGDVHGAQLRNNLLYFGVGRHGFGLGATCDGPECATGHDREEVPCAERERIEHDVGCEGTERARQERDGCIFGRERVDRERFERDRAERPCEHDRGCDRGLHRAHVPPPAPAACGDHGRDVNQPYLRVTPTVVVRDITKTHTETATSIQLNVETQLVTRTVTDTLLSTHTQVFHPIETITFVEHHTAYEYPASTINAGQVRGAVPTPRA